MSNANGQVAQVETVDPRTGEIATVNPTLGPIPGMDNDLHSQITTAKRYPRSVKMFRNKVLELATLNEAIAGECIYALPRGGKTIEGPSIRFAEIVLSAWGNCRVGSKVVGEEDSFLVCQGMFHDLESNAAIAMEVKRRITDSKGRRYNEDMIGVAGAAGTAIARRNAILSGVPKAFWADLYDSARQVVAGDFKTLANRRAAALQAFVIYGVTDKQIYDFLKVSGYEDITVDHLVTLRGVLNALKDGSATPEDVFPKVAEVSEKKPSKSDIKVEPRVDAKADTKAEAKIDKKDDKAAEREPAQEEQKSHAPEPSADLKHALSSLESARQVEEIQGMRDVLRMDLDKYEFGVWQASAMKREMELTKKGKK